MVNDHFNSKSGHPLLRLHGLLFSINSNVGIFYINTIPQTGQHIPRPLLHQSWSTGWNKKEECNSLIWWEDNENIFSMLAKMA